MASTAALVFAGKSVATPAISFLVNKAFTYLNEYRKAEGMDEMKTRILFALPKIQAVFDVVNPAYIKEESSALDAWLWQLRDAVEKAEDAVDEVEYYELEEKAKDRKVSDWGSSFAKMKHKAIKSVKQSSIVHKTTKGLTHRGTLKRLRRAVEGLDKAAEGVVPFLALADRFKGHTGQKEDDFLSRARETGSMLTATEVFGRQEEKEQLIRWLTKASDEDSEIVVGSNHLSLVSIVGHGGMGKTTLAQLVRQDDTVKNHFDEVIWACVSTSFDAKTIISKILESATWTKPDANTLEALQRTLEKKLNSKRFLIILDDVWEDKKVDQWEKLFACLRTGKSGSKIMLTTRMQSVVDLAANALGGKNECLPLQGLEEDENIKLFNRHAFPCGSFQDYTALQPIGEQIANKVIGCPLVTKVVAFHLRDNLTFQHWNNFLHQRLEHFRGSAQDIMNVLMLSYYHLPTEVQTCFRYCSIFPQDYEFEKDQLVNMWLSSGLILEAECGTQRPQDIGEEYLDQLTRKSFFDRSTHAVYRKSPRYVMHDLMHDLAVHVSLGECARIADIASLENVGCTVRHICIEDIDNFPVEKIKEKCCLENLRTIIINGRYKDEEAVSKDILNKVEELVESSKSLRLFQTKLWHTSEFLAELGKLKHLRFLELQQISPKSICGIVKLYHLTVLYCDSEKIESKQLRDIGNLDRLRYVDLKHQPSKLHTWEFPFGNLQHWQFELDTWKFPVGRLVSLQVLNNYYIRYLKGYTVSALRDLTSLRRLEVKGLQNVGDHEEAKEAKLKEKQYLDYLSLQWQFGSSGARTEELILDNLEPHANLKELYISGYNGTRLPRWIAKPSIKNLERLELMGCRNCEQLPVLEILTLKHLKLKDLPKLKKIDQALSVSEYACVELFLPPNLETLEVYCCFELRELPVLPPSLESLKIAKAGLTKLPRIGKLHKRNAESVSTQLRDISIMYCESLTSLEGSLFEQRQYMGALRQLHIIDCVQLESGPLPFEEMNRLEEVSIRACPMLRTIRGAEDNKLLPSSLRRLVMHQCGDLELPLLGSLQGLTDLDFLCLSGYTTVESLPSADVFESLKSVRTMVLRDCEDLSSLGGLGSLQHIGALEIAGCRRLAEAGLTPARDVSGREEEHLVVPTSAQQIDALYIDLPSLLLVEPLRSLCHTRGIQINDGSEMESLPERWLLQNRSSLQHLCMHNARSLESLPSSMQDLTALEDLILYDAVQLRSLPDLPSSLKRLDIYKCDSELAEKFREFGSPERNKISHVREAIIGGSYFIMGKKCSSYNTFDKLSCADDNTLSSWLSQPEESGKGIESASNSWGRLCCLRSAS
ncbi:hypothetical protein ACP70R_019923 [Stipagrostis hirtigluma subsp. patula]